MSWKKLRLFIASVMVLGMNLVMGVGSCQAGTEPTQGADTPVQTPYIEGRHYQVLTEDVQSNDVVENFKKEGAGKIQVVEFFSYGCSWCYRLDPVVSEWVKQLPPDVAFERVPVEFQPSWRTLTKAYFTATSLNVLDKIHEPLFDAIHSEKLTDSSEPALMHFFAEHGITADVFEETFSSFTVNRKQKWANALSQAYRITAIPTLLIQGADGAYLSSVRMAGSEENLIQIANYLIERERAAAVPKQSQ